MEQVSGKGTKEPFLGLGFSLFLFLFLCSSGLLSHFSHVQFCVTPWTIAHQALLFMSFSRQEYWRGLPCPAPGDSSQSRDQNCVSYVFFALPPLVKTCRPDFSPGSKRLTLVSGGFLDRRLTLTCGPAVAPSVRTNGFPSAE